MLSLRFTPALVAIALFTAAAAFAQTPASAAPTLGPPSARAFEEPGRVSPPPPAERPAWLPLMFVVGPALGAGAIFLALRRNKRGGPPSA
jgi:hypothetical protein